MFGAEAVDSAFWYTSFGNRSGRCRAHRAQFRAPTRRQIGANGFMARDPHVEQTPKLCAARRPRLVTYQIHDRADVARVVALFRLNYEGPWRERKG
jgi:hypothetical protein